MINKDELRQFVLNVLREDLTIHVDLVPESSHDHAKIQVSLRLPNEKEPWMMEEFAFSEDRFYG